MVRKQQEERVIDFGIPNFSRPNSVKGGPFSESKNNNQNAIISISEYRKVLNDYKSSEEQIIKRLNYLEGFCRNIIQTELGKYVAKKTKYKNK